MLAPCEENDFQWDLLHPILLSRCDDRDHGGPGQDGHSLPSVSKTPAH